MVWRATMPKTATTTTNAKIAAISGRKVRYWRHVRGGKGVAALTPFAASSSSDILFSTSLLTSSNFRLRFSLFSISIDVPAFSLYLPSLSAHFMSSDFRAPRAVPTKKKKIDSYQVQEGDAEPEDNLEDLGNNFLKRHGRGLQGLGF